MRKIFSAQRLFQVMRLQTQVSFFSEIKVVKFFLDLGVIKTKVVSFSKKLFLLSLLVSIELPGLFRSSEHDLE